MHSLELANLAAVYASYCAEMLEAKSFPSRQQQQAYWLECRYRHEHWSARLADHRHDMRSLGVSHRRQCWQRILPIMEEILISEPLTRCLTYHSRLLAQHRIDQDFAGMCNSVLASHIEARHRCLHLIVFGEGLAVEHTMRLNRLRRELECYSDSLLGALPTVDDLEHLCFDKHWVRQLQDNPQSPVSSQSSAPRIHFDSQRMSLRPLLEGSLHCSLLGSNCNGKIHAAVIGLLPQSLFDSLGVPKSIGFSRLLADNAQDSTKAGQLFQQPTSSLTWADGGTRRVPPSAGLEKPRWN
jgi:hypothetical protein